MKSSKLGIWLHREYAVEDCNKEEAAEEGGLEKVKIELDKSEIKKEEPLHCLGSSPFSLITT